MKRFFAEEIHDNIALLSPEEQHHCMHVMRVKDGEEVEIIDGVGGLWLASVQYLSKRSIQISLFKQLDFQETTPVYTSLAVALTKNIDRIEWLLEKATEIGIHHFIPIISHRTERSKARLDRLEKILLSATKQSHRLWKPILHEPINFKTWVAQADFEQKFIAHCIDSSNKKFLKDMHQKGTSSVILIGPEGDFTPEEVDWALQHHFQEVSLGSARLRVETAALVACVTMMEE